MKHLIVVFIFLVNSLFAQNRIVLNGAYINITNGANLVIDNSASNAITVNSGHIISEGENNNLKWNLGLTAGTYTVPLGYNTTDYIPIVFTKNAGTGSGVFNFATYKTTDWQNSLNLPTGVPNVNNNSGADNSAFVIDRFWKIDASGYSINPDLTNLVITYIDAEHAVASNTITEANLIPQRYNSTLSAWGDFLPASTINTTSNEVTVASLPNSDLFKWWTLSSSTSPLPIELLYFKAELNNLNTVDLTWATASEINNDYFIIQRSSDGYSWQTINKVNANGTTVVQHNYSAVDTKPFNGITYYRIQQVDFGGTYSYTNIESVELYKSGSINVIPNPFTQFCALQIQGFANIKLLEIFNSIGQVVKSIVVEEQDQQIVFLDFTNIASGIYYLKADGVTINQKLIKQ